MPFTKAPREKTSPRRQNGDTVFPLSLFGRRSSGRETAKEQLETLEQQSELLKGMRRRW